MIGKPTNRGALVSMDRARQQRADNRKAIRALPDYRTGFTCRDTGLEISVSRRELREMVGDGILVASKGRNGTLVYRSAPPSLMSRRWRVDESVYAELEAALDDL